MAPKTTESKSLATPATEFVSAESTPAPEPKKPTRFDHPEAYSVLVLAPYDNYHHRFVQSQLDEEFNFLETPPQVVGELRADQLFPGVVIYVAHQTQSREKDPATGRFEIVKKLHVSEPIKLQEYFGVNRSGTGGLKFDELFNKIRSVLSNDVRGLYWCVRPTADGGIKIFDN